MRVLRSLLALVTVALILLVVGNADTSPGPLHPAHTADVRLAGAAGCTGCHGDGGGAAAIATACGTCHRQILDSVRARSGLHGSLPEALACGSCHIEHRGAVHDLVGSLAFAKAGIADVLDYDHPHGTGSPLAGRHLELACEVCHRQAWAAVLAPGETRFLGLSRACSTCHDDVHAGAFGADCRGCHQQTRPFTEAPGLLHAGFPLVEGHAGRACAECHEPGGPHSVAVLHAAPGTMARDCVDCHRSPHADGSTGPGSGLVLARSADCRACHSTRSFTPPTVTASEHGRLASGFVLEGQHAMAACVRCHGPAGAVAGVDPAVASAIDPRDCRRCHESPHAPAFGTQAFGAPASGAPSSGALSSGAPSSGASSSGCASCHAAAARSFRRPEAQLPPAAHAVTGLPLVPPHDKVSCAQCHRRATGLEIVEPARAAADCAACHQDVHAGQFAAAASRGRCVTCHSETGFQPSKFDLHAHREARMPLTGAHLAVGCFQCHKSDEDGVRRFRGTPTGCGECHEDVHRGAFDTPGKPRVVGGATGCARCHDTERFGRESWPGFDHALWTGHALRGSHAGLACGDCHARGVARPGVQPPVQASVQPVVQPSVQPPARPMGGLSRACASCHVDPHLGQFRRAGNNDCSRCHTEDQPFARTRFDHARQSRFKLDEQHRKLACSACHRAVKTSTGTEVVRYRPLGLSCGDCHQPARRAGR